MKPSCAAPVLGALGRASICGKPATTKRVVELPFCATCALGFDEIGPFVRVKLEPKIFARLEAMAVSLAPSGDSPRREEAFRLAVGLGLEAWEVGKPEEGGAQ